jgi:hypothetical protein
MILALLDFLDPEKLISTVGMIGLFAIVFAETGVLAGFFLPGAIHQMLRSNLSWAARRPAVKSSESPGRKKPINRPHSAKTITRTASKAQAPSDSMRLCGSRTEAAITP